MPLPANKKTTQKQLVKKNIRAAFFLDTFPRNEHKLVLLHMLNRLWRKAVSF